MTDSFYSRLKHLSPWLHGVAWLLLTCFWLLPLSYFHGKAQWENLGDAHFYAASTQHLITTGEHRWLELYPIALKKKSGIDMGFSAPLHFECAALFAYGGLTAQEAVLIVSSLSILLWVSIFFCLGCYVWKFPALGWAMGLSLGLCPSLWEFSTSGGSDALGLFLFNLSILSFYFFLKRNLLIFWGVGLAVAIGAALSRPQGQLLLLFCPLILLSSGRKNKLWAGLFWIFALATLKIFQYKILGGRPLVFPYAFSFLVGTTPWPGHALFREYFPDGFGLHQVWELRHLWMEKISLGGHLLKQYWGSWTWTFAIFILGLFYKKTRQLSILLIFILSCLLFLSAFGHRVPRYWTFMMSPAIFIAWIWMKPLILTWRHSPWAWGLPISLFSFLCVEQSPWLQSPRNRDLHLCEIPQVIQEKLVTCDWVATDRPALVIDSFQKPILLLPNRIEQLIEIHQQVHPMMAVLFTPQLKDGEQSNWLGQKLSLSKFGWNKEAQEQGWELYLKK